MAEPSDPRRRRWWQRRRPAPIATTRICPACHAAGPAQLLPDQVCAACEAQRAWSQLGDGARLVIDRDSIAAAVRRRQGEAAGASRARRLSVLAPPAVTLGVAALTAWCVGRVVAARSIGPLDALLDAWRTDARGATLLGVCAVILGGVALRRSRRSRHFRRIPILASHLIAIAIGGTAIAVGGVHWRALGEPGWRYTAMPPRTPLGVPSQVERILDATVVVLAPDADGDVRDLAIGTGAVIARDDARAWIVTCSHVAMPYVSAAAPRHARDAQPVWVQLADGRDGKAVVRWAAPPPIDVVVLELAMRNAPDPVPIAADSTAIQASTSVTFVPNPYRAGWKVLSGELIGREPHRTPAGAYDLLYTDLPVISGDSGSGLYDARGRLVGLNTWTRIGDGTSHGISLPSETLRVLGDAIRRGTLDTLEEAAPPAPRP